jgi:molybdopterin-containing oxidoreductase family membrane subunit
VEGEPVKAVYALYADPEDAQRAVNALRTAGIAERDITIVSGEPIEEYEFSQRDKATWLHWIAGVGGAVGLIIAAWLSSMTERAWPLVTGNMPIVAWWPNLIIMFELTMLCGILATVITLFITAKLPGRDPKLYDAEVTEGKILVGVENPPEASVAELERALLASGAGRLKTI